MSSRGIAESERKNEKIFSRGSRRNTVENTTLKGRPHARATPLLCRGVCVRGSRCAQGNVYGDMRVPQTDREDRDRSSRSRWSRDQFAAVVPGGHGVLGLRGGVFSLRAA